MVLAFAAMHILQSCIQTFSSHVWLQTNLQSLTVGQRLFSLPQCSMHLNSYVICMIGLSASDMYLITEKSP